MYIFPMAAKLTAHINSDVSIHFTVNSGLTQHEWGSLRDVCVCVGMYACCVPKSRLVNCNWYVLGPMKFPSHFSGHSHDNLFPWKLKHNARHHGLAFPIRTQTQTHTHGLKRNSGAWGSLQSRTRGIKNRARSWIYKCGGKIRGSENQSLSGSPIRTLTVLYKRTMMDLIQLKHSGTGEVNLNLIRYDKGF